MFFISISAPQEAEFGINMYDSIVPDDETAIEELQMQGFTREEAILLIFEEKFGKTSNQPKYITPAMPTLHSVNISDTGSVRSGAESTVSTVKRRGALAAEEPDFTTEEEELIEANMAKGYTREQAVAVFLQKRSTAADRRSVPSQSQSSVCFGFHAP
jgi:hypothetical protein